MHLKNYRNHPSILEKAPALTTPLTRSKARDPENIPPAIVVIGASTGGTKAIEYIVKELKSDTNAVYLMAKSAIEKGGITKVLSLTQIPGYINRFTEYHRIQPNKWLYGYHA